MLSCWDREASERPKFSDLVDTVNDLLEKDFCSLELTLSSTPQLETKTSPLPCLSRADIELEELKILEYKLDNDSSDMQGSDSTVSQ